MRKGKPRRPAPDEMLTMAPYPALSISGTANRMHKYELVKQESIVYRQSSMRYSWTALVGPASPALFTSVSSLPKSLTAIATARRTSSSTLASQTIAIALPPAAVIPAAVSFTRSPERAAQATAAPSRAKRSLSALPIPREAPVMSATRPSSNPILPSAHHVTQHSVPLHPSAFPLSISSAHVLTSRAELLCGQMTRLPRCTNATLPRNALDRSSIVTMTGVAELYAITPGLAVGPDAGTVV